MSKRTDSIVDQLCRDLLLERSDLDVLVANVDSQYKSFHAGGRRIDAPKLGLKYVQCWILDFVRAETSEPPRFVTAYESGRGIVHNAEFHRRNSHLLVMDIRHFFRSCTEGKVRSFYEHMSVGEGSARKILRDSEVQTLTSLSVHRGSLPMGSPCSPVIANRIMEPVDSELMSGLGPHYAYSRYSDDICVSSKERIDVGHVLRITRHVLESHGFRLNDKKVRCMGRGDARRVTGVFIMPDGTLSIGSKRKGELNRKLYQFLVHGDGDASEIRGILDFARSVNPRYVTELLLKYQNYGYAAEYGGVMAALEHVSA